MHDAPQHLEESGPVQVQGQLSSSSVRCLRVGAWGQWVNNTQSASPLRWDWPEKRAWPTRALCLLGFMKPVRKLDVVERQYSVQRQSGHDRSMAGSVRSSTYYSVCSMYVILSPCCLQR